MKLKVNWNDHRRNETRLLYVNVRAEAERCFHSRQALTLIFFRLNRFCSISGTQHLLPKFGPVDSIFVDGVIRRSQFKAKNQPGG